MLECVAYTWGVGSPSAVESCPHSEISPRHESTAGFRGVAYYA